MHKSRLRSGAISQVGFRKCEVSLKGRNLENALRVYRPELPSITKHDERSARGPDPFFFFTRDASLMQCCTRTSELKNLNAFFSCYWQASDSSRICVRGYDLDVY